MGKTQLIIDRCEVRSRDPRIKRFGIPHHFFHCLRGDFPAVLTGGSVATSYDCMTVSFPDFRKNALKGEVSRCLRPPRERSPPPVLQRTNLAEIRAAMTV